MADSDRQEAGAAQVMAAQLDRLIACAWTPGIVLQVVPFDAGDHAGTDDPIVLLARYQAGTGAGRPCR